MARFFRRRTAVAALVAALASGFMPPAQGQEPVPVPLQVFTDPAGMVDDPQGIVAGPDGNLWFTSADNDRIGRITPTGAITTYADPGVDRPWRITVGPDGALWFTSFANDRIGRITTTGAITTFADPAGTVDGPLGITTGPDGALWFTSFSNNRIGRITTTGTITTYTDPPGSPQEVYFPWGITTGPDGNVWYTNGSHAVSTDAIGRVSTGGVITGFNTTNIANGKEIVAGPDGNLWFVGITTTFSTMAVWRATPAGAITRFSIGDNGQVLGTAGATVGPDGTIWFTEQAHDLVGRATPTGTLTTFSDELGTGESGVLVSNPTTIAAGSDGAMWFTSSANDRIGRLVLGAPLEGKITGPAEPIGGAWVLAVTEDGSAVRGARTSNISSSVDGKYALFLDPGHYRVEIIDPTGNHAGEWHDDQPLSQLDDATIVDLPAEGATINATLSPAGQTARVTGTVTRTGTSTALGGIDVAAFDLTDGRLAGSALTNSAGAYTIDGLAAGPHLVIFFDPTAAHTPEIHPGSGTPVPVVLQAGVATTVNADLATATVPPSTTSISGTITAAGNPLSGGWVAAVDANTGRFAGAATTSGTGTYSLALPAGNHVVESIDPTGDHAAEWHPNQPITGLAGASPVTATVSTPAVVNADLDPTGPTATVSGTITSATGGDPVAGAWIAALRSADGGFARGTVAAVDGTYTLDGLTTGTYVVAFIDPTGAHHYEFNDDATNFADATPVAVTAGNTTALNASLAPS